MDSPLVTASMDCFQSWPQTIFHCSKQEATKSGIRSCQRCGKSSMSCGKSTHKIFYTQTLLHMVLLHKHTLTHRRFDTQKPLHANAFTHRRFYTQTLLHTDAFTHTLLHTKAFTHRRFYTQTLLHAGAVKVHTKSFTHKRFYTWCFYTNTL